VTVLVVVLNIELVLTFATYLDELFMISLNVFHPDTILAIFAEDASITLLNGVVPKLFTYFSNVDRLLS